MMNGIIYYKTKTLLCVVLAILAMASGGSITLKEVRAAGAADIGVALAAPIIRFGAGAALKKMGIDPTNGVLPAIEKMQRGIEQLDTKIDGVLSEIKQQNFSNAYNNAKKDSSTIIAHARTISGWEDMQAIPTQEIIQRIFKELTEALQNLNTHLNDERVGMIPTLMKTDQYAKVTDLQAYWADIRDIRANYSALAALALLAYEQASAYQTKNWELCQNGRKATPAKAKPDAKTETVFVGDEDTVCRDVRGNGGPHDPKAKARDNEYFKIGRTVSERSACEEQCVAGCKGVEYRRGYRCELWKVTVTPRSGKGYECRQKVVRKAEASTPALSEGAKECQKDYPRFPPIWAKTLQKEAQALHRAMYAHGVPLIENRNAAGFIHLRNAPWALAAPPVRGAFSGYFATHTGTRLTSKLDALAANYKPSQNRNLSLEKFLEKHLIPTRFVNEWKCEAIITYCTQGDSTYLYGLHAKLVEVVGNRVIKKDVLIDPEKMSQLSCNKKLKDGKTYANKNYRIARNKLAGGIKILAHYKGYSDCQLGDGRAFGKVNVNKQYFGRFFTFNLKDDDCKRACTGGMGSQRCKYCGSRLDIGGRAALTSRAAVDDFISSLAK